MRIFFLGDITEKRRSTILASFQKLCPRSKHQIKMTLSFLVHRSARNHKQADLLGKKINEMEKVDGIVEKLDAHYGFFMLKNCFSLPKLYFLRTSTCFNHAALLEKYDITVHDGLSKVCNVNFDDFWSTQLAPPAEMGCLGVPSSSLLALPVFLATAFGASDFLTTFSRKQSKMFHVQKRFRNG